MPNGRLIPQDESRAALCHPATVAESQRAALAPGPCAAGLNP